jgi:hypothetical protein
VAIARLKISIFGLEGRKATIVSGNAKFEVTFEMRKVLLFIYSFPETTTAVCFIHSLALSHLVRLKSHTAGSGAARTEPR